MNCELLRVSNPYKRTLSVALAPDMRKESTLNRQGQSVDRVSPQSVDWVSPCVCALQIPHITFIIHNVVFAQKLAVFFLKGAAAMVFLLGLPILSTPFRSLDEGLVQV